MTDEVKKALNLILTIFQSIEKDFDEIEKRLDKLEKTQEQLEKEIKLMRGW